MSSSNREFKKLKKTQLASYIINFLHAWIWIAYNAKKDIINNGYTCILFF